MKYINALNTIEGVGRIALATLLHHFESAEKAWRASAKEIMAAGVPEKLARIIVDSRPNIDPDEQWAVLEKEGITAISIRDKNYPALLKEIPTPPYLIYVRGNLGCFDLPMISIVGSRKYTSYGEQAARHFARDLAQAGICVISGLALGIDAIAHRACLEAGGKTIAVMGNSVDDANISPRTNYELAQDILANGGLLLSEFSVPTPPVPGLFVARNRIMAGLSTGTVVVEAAIASGSLITANFANEFNRDVFAVPGPINSPQSEGTNNLIKEGAKLTTCVNDILEELRLATDTVPAAKKIALNLTAEEKLITDVLSPEPTHIDRIAKLTKLEPSAISANLAMLEIKGVIKNIGGQNYIKL